MTFNLSKNFRSKLFLVGVSLIFGLAAPGLALANCRWVPNGSCADLDMGWIQATSDTYCNYKKGPNDRWCCCGAENVRVGCCQVSDFHSGPGGAVVSYSAFVATENKCNNTALSSFFSPYPLYDIQTVPEGQKCFKNESDCFWVLNNNCSDIGMWQGAAARCDGKFKPDGDTVKCCCGKDVPQGENKTATTDQTVKKTATLFNYSNVTNPLRTVSVPTVIGRVINAFLLIVGSIFLLVVIYGGFMWMTAAGNEAKVKKGRQTLMWSVLGIIVIFLAWMIVGFIFEALNV